MINKINWSNLGLNIKYMREETWLDPWLYGTVRIKEELIKHNMSVVPPSDVWRISLAKKLINERLMAYYQGNDDYYKYLNGILHSLVSTWFIDIFLFYIICPTRNHIKNEYINMWHSHVVNQLCVDCDEHSLLAAATVYLTSRHTGKFLHLF